MHKRIPAVLRQGAFFLFSAANVKGDTLLKAQAKIKDWSEVTITNRFMFYKVFTSYPGACKRMLEILLGMRISRIEYPQGERVFDIDAEAHSVRLDVFTQDKGRLYDIEMQTVDEEDLPERARYYQGMMDVATLKPGEPYRNLKDSIVLFICLSDPFNGEKAKYEFKNLDTSDRELELGDRTLKVFFNASKYDRIDEDEELKSLLAYFSSSKTDSAFASSLDSLVKTARRNEQWRQTYMTLERFKYYAEREGLREGRKAGFEQGLRSGIRQGLKQGIQQGIQQGVQQGIQQGIKQGMQQGIEQGMKEGLSHGAARQKAEDQKLIDQQNERIRKLEETLAQMKK